MHDVINIKTSKFIHNHKSVTLHCIFVPHSVSMTTHSHRYGVNMGMELTWILVNIQGQRPDHFHFHWSSFCYSWKFQYADDALTCGTESVYKCCLFKCTYFAPNKPILRTSSLSWQLTYFGCYEQRQRKLKRPSVVRF